MHSRYLPSLLVGSLLTTSAFGQQPETPDNAALRAELEALRARVEQLESETPAMATQRERVEFSGDLRYRHESINDDAATERSRHRIRARFRVNAELSEDISVGMTLATGGGNPVSGNQSLSAGLSRKDIGFDRAYFAWNVDNSWTLTGGKMPNPWFRPGGSHLVFDSDLNPEGLALGYDGESVFATISGFWIDERSGGDDSLLYAAQGGFRTTIGEGIDLTVGGGFLNYTGVRGFASPYFLAPRGNTTVGAVALANDYDIVEIFAEATLELGDQPLRLFIDLVENTDATAYDSGYAFGARWRRAGDAGTWDVSWAYEDLEADAVLASFTDSDFAGGGTDGKGHVFRGTYMIRDNVRFNGSYFLNERGEAVGNERDYRRLQLDLSFLF